MGSTDDIEALYRNHAAALLRFACGLCGSQSAAEDIVSETFMRVLTRAPKIRAGTARAYLLAVARNVFIDGVRRSVRSEPLANALENDAVDLEGRLDDRLRLVSVLKAVGGLPEGERAAFLLRVDQGLSYDEIAAVLGVSVVAAKVRVHRARMRLAAAGREKEMQG